jgi:hypothetical protein
MNDKPKASCTCISCEEGWLSPKMRVWLQGKYRRSTIRFIPLRSHEIATATASRIDHLMSQNELRFGTPSGSPLSDDKVHADPLLHYLPALVQKRVFITFYRGYHGIISIIERILSGQESRNIPYVGVVRRLVPARHFFYRNTRASDEMFYLDKDGRIVHALDCLISTAEKADDAGDTTFLERTAQMQECANDGNFDLIRRRLGLWGYLPDTENTNDERMTL